MRQQQALCNWCGAPVVADATGEASWLCPECDSAHEAEAARPHDDGPKESYEL